MNFISDISFADSKGNRLNFYRLTKEEVGVDIIGVDVNGHTTVTFPLSNFCDMIKLLSEIVEGRGIA
jgi:hypothetical protein